jgi:hypothetical protein
VFPSLNFCKNFTHFLTTCSRKKIEKQVKMEKEGPEGGRGTGDIVVEWKWEVVGWKGGGKGVEKG